MTTIVAIFLTALLLSLAVTPAVARLGVRLGVVDQPGRRKVHERPVPRIGGLAIYLAFFGSFVPMLFPWVMEQTRLLQLVGSEPRMIAVAIGSAVAFGLGLYDDNRGLGPGVKFGIQALAALVAFAGGVRIDSMGVPGLGPVHFGWFALPVTVFWILLVINAINLIDGLDGLAAGVSFFACMVLVVLCVIGNNYMTATVLAALAGAILGFLRYNFNPAIIFMGDGGSYFLGYMLATTSIVGSIKGQAAATLLIPVVALGVPLLDTVWATVRRFVVGKALFQPDREHFHHRLLRLGYSHRKAVLLLYAATILFGAAALLLVHLRDERTGLILLLVAVVVVFGIRRLGYFDYLRGERVLGWLRELGDDAGLPRERRSFILEQIRISESQSLRDLWLNVTEALDKLDFDMAALYLNSGYSIVRDPSASTNGGRRMTDGRGQPAEDGEQGTADRGQGTEDRGQRSEVGDLRSAGGGRRKGPSDRFDSEPADPENPAHPVPERRRTPPLQASVSLRRRPPDFVWYRGLNTDTCRRCPLRIELELSGERTTNFGTLLLLKDVNRSGMPHYTLKRVEHLRRNVIATLDNLFAPP